MSAGFLVQLEKITAKMTVIINNKIPAILSTIAISLENQIVQFFCHHTNILPGGKGVDPAVHRVCPLVKLGAGEDFIIVSVYNASSTSEQVE
ncbi:hypothetical protein A2V95_02015 [Candidatus Kuenenbacteria bacterium RBG_16_41_7]|uniref:Uncharacterized protein n=1 Tax=Candidatus Kuenenbacteria bacterium RBG_16_41_7 TaxID=1798560 RepID=A0A1F6GD12_9BACT|nr:MAG: hypothetical protein A2V95_02015 [Candidatus Kuenenbacteria bacterium RBG_16_41_7]